MAGSIELHYGPAVSNLCDRFLEDKAKNLNGVIYLVHHRSRAEYLKEKYILVDTKNPAKSYPFTTYAYFFNQLFSQLNLSAQKVADSLKILLLHTVFFKEQSELKYFNFHQRQIPPGIVGSMVQYFDEIRLNDQDILLLRDREQKLDLSAIEKIQHDIQLLFSGYLEAKGTTRLDEADLLKKVIRYAGKEFFGLYYPDRHTIVIEDVSFFKQLHIQLLMHLKSMGFHIYLLLPYGRNKEIFAPKRNLFVRLQEISDHQKIYPEKRKISEYLFQIKFPGINFEDKITIVPSLNRFDEIEEIAGKIKKLIVDEDLRFSQIAIASPQLEKYRPLIETVFKRFRIPYTIHERRLLKDALPIKNIELLIDLVTEQYPLEMIRRILQSPFFVYKERLNNWNFTEALSGLRVRSGKDRILNALQNAREFYRNEREEENSEARTIDNYDNLVEVVKELFRDVAFMESAQPGKKLLQNWKYLITKHQFVKNTFRQSERGNSLLAWENFLAVRKFLMTFREWIYQSENEGGIRKYDVKILKEIFLFIVSTVSYRTVMMREFGVQILNLAQLTSQSFHSIFMIGMEDAVFPRARVIHFTQPHYLPDRLKNFLREDHLFRERELFLQLLQLPAASIQFSFARYQQDDLVLPSVFLRELQRISQSDLNQKAGAHLPRQTELFAQFRIEQPNLFWEKKDISPYIRDMLCGEMVDFYKFRSDVARQREQPGVLSRWEGILSDDQVISQWMKMRYSEKYFSPTELEIYAKCPMQYFIQRVLNLEPAEEGEEFISALDRGIALHQILFNFYLFHREKGLPGLKALTLKELDKIPVQRGLLWDIEKEFYLGGENLKGIIPAFWESELALKQLFKTVPRYFEWSFGRKTSGSRQVDPASSVEPFVWRQDRNSYSFKGVIDRLEISDDGTLLVVDYKTGTIPNLYEMWEGKRLQLPVYLKAASDLLEARKKKIKMAGGAFYIIRKENEIEKRVIFVDRESDIGPVKTSKTAMLEAEKFREKGPPPDLNQFIDRIFAHAVRYIDGIRAGKFPHTAEEEQCRRWDGSWCEFLPVCRVNWKKLKNMNPKPAV